ncbi:MAG: 23S rRNA (guanosine(2251)-2'-O)-methyltransferase RlmB [Anaerolineae bacterium]|nr:23S rRNA (guanosine(2251)-2'-O)-methyltransferase RlmB [Anaerolineae bacterium]
MRETLYGRNAVYEALRAGRREFYRISIVDTVRATDVVSDILTMAEAARIPVQRISRRDLNWLEDANHQGVTLEASDFRYVDINAILATAKQRGEPPFLLLLDLIQDPQNLGSLIRTAEAVGVHGVVIQDRRAAGVSPAVVNSSSGAVEHLLVAQVTNLSQTIDTLKAYNVWVAGLEAARGAKRYDQADLTGALALVVGSEGSGLRRLVEEKCDFLVEMPMKGKITSLNAAVAGSIVLYEALRQRQTAAA